MSLESLISSEPSVPYIWQEGRLWKPWYKEHPTTIFSMNERQRRIITALVYLWVCRCIVGMSVYCPDEVGIGSMPWSSLLSISPVSAIPLCISHGGPSESPGAWGGYHNLSQYFGLIHLTVDGEGERVALVHKMATWKKKLIGHQCNMFALAVFQDLFCPDVLEVNEHHHGKCPGELRPVHMLKRKLCLRFSRL